MKTTRCWTHAMSTHSAEAHPSCVGVTETQEGKYQCDARLVWEYDWRKLRRRLREAEKALQSTDGSLARIYLMKYKEGGR